MDNARSPPTSQCCPLQDTEKENDHKPFRKSGKVFDVGTAICSKRAAKLYCLKDERLLQNTPDAKPGPVQMSKHPSKFSITPAPAPADAKTPAPLLRDACSNMSVDVTPETPGVQKLSLLERLPGRPAASPPAPPKRVSISPQGMEAVGRAKQSQDCSGAVTLLHARPNGKPFVRVRARRTLILQADTGMAAQGQKPAICGRHNRCTRSADDIQLNRARVHQAALAALTRSADWPAVSCIRKRAEEATEYEPRKSFKKGPESQSWQAAAACLAKGVCNLSVQDKQNSVRFGAATIIGE